MLHYRSYSGYCKNRFGVPVAKIPVSGGFSCPNRDGTLSDQGCAFCDNEAFSRVAHASSSPVDQAHAAITKHRSRFTAFIVYAQPFSNTYGPLERLRAVYEPLLALPGVVGLSIGTRPDCISDAALEYLAGLATRTCLTVELGVQSSHDTTLRAINRGHDYAAFVDAVQRLAGYNIETVAHLILGLPGETIPMMFETAERMASLPVHGIKFHQLMIIRGTALERMYDTGGVTALTLNDYAPIVCGCIERLRPDQVVHRIMADTRKDHGLIAPEWSADKQGSIRALHAFMDQTRVEQGRLWKAEEAEGCRL